MMVIVGGSGYFLGPFLGAIIAVLLPEWLRVIEGYYLILYSLFVMVLLIWSPTGIARARRPLDRGAAHARRVARSRGHRSDVRRGQTP